MCKSILNELSDFEEKLKMYEKELTEEELEQKSEELEKEYEELGFVNILKNIIEDMEKGD